ncbi:signal transduction histidine kinase [Nakamurella flavida]|nr:HAMP domain-containing sensor histidine kinase [Nakamurella flavida]MDP9777373.1 signal transduction histidine kinase [Nakamurella flavida]
MTGPPPRPDRSAWSDRVGLRLRITVLTTALLALIGALLLGLAYVLVGRVIAALPQFPPGTEVILEGRVVDAELASQIIVEEGRRTVLLVGFIAFPLQVIAGAVLAWILIGRALTPLTILTTAARDLSTSSLDQRIRLTGPRDEVAELSDTFDDMLDRLQGAFEAERRFVANASHELRTPLAVIRTEIDVTLSDPHADPAELRRMAEVVREATDGADRLLSALLVLARTQARGVSEIRPVDMALLVPGALHGIEIERAERGVHVTVDGGPCLVAGDPALLQRLVGNLVENAVRHNVPGGWLRVTTEPAPAVLVPAAAGATPAPIGGAEAGVDLGEPGVAYAALEVASSGPVVDAATVEEIFEPFRQGRRARTSHGGSGLGLSIVRAVVSAHDGLLWARPVDGGGLSIRVLLPAVDPATVATGPGAPGPLLMG